MKIFHTGDIHYCPKHLEGVDHCFTFAVEKAIEERCDVAVLGGDLFDHRVDVHSPAVSRLMTQVARLADHMPVLILQGTYSHDVPGSLDVFKTMDRRFPVFVADRICQVAIIGTTFVDSTDWVMESDWLNGISEVRALFSCLPSVNKGAVAALVGAENAAEAVGEHVFNLLKGWAPINRAARAAWIPTVGVSHGTVNGCMTEQGVVMAGLDHEYSAGALFAAECSAFMLNHIHQHQEWSTGVICNGVSGLRTIAYSGSVERLHFGEISPKGFLIWQIEANHAECQLIETPAKRLLQIDFPGSPDMEELARAAADAADAHVRIRYAIDEEHRHSVDKAAIAAMFAHAAEVKIEGRVNPIVRTRSEGITRMSLHDKLNKWAEVTGTDPNPLSGRLTLLTHMEPETVVAELLGDTKKEKAA